MQKTRIEVRADLAACTKACKTAPLQVEDERNNSFDGTDNDKEAKIDSPNMGLVEFDIQT